MIIQKMSELGMSSRGEGNGMATHSSISEGTEGQLSYANVAAHDRKNHSIPVWQRNPHYLFYSFQKQSEVHP